MTTQKTARFVALASVVLAAFVPAVVAMSTPARPVVAASPARAGVVINVPEVTIVASAPSNPKAAPKPAPRPQGPKAVAVRVIELDQQGRPGATTVRAWGL